METSSRLIEDFVAEDYWQEIFLRLPVKTLCRFRIVCKSWNNLISSPFFINLHRSFTPSDSDVFNPISDVYFPFHFKLRGSFHDSQSIKIVDVVSGLVCISYSNESAYDTTIIWNPAIRRYINLPHPPFPSHINSAVAPLGADLDIIEAVRFYSNVIGFGYDGVRDEFKVVRIWLTRPWIENQVGYIPTTYQVYSTEQRKWKKTMIVESIKTLVIDIRSRSGCFFDKKIHWLVKTEDQTSRCALVFDCETEELTTMDTPVFGPKVVMRAELLEYGGRLSMIVQLRSKELCEMWAMNEGSWSKVMTIECVPFHPMSLYEPGLMTKLAPNGPRNRIQFRKYTGRFHSVFTYKESLVLIDDPRAKSYLINNTINIYLLELWPRIRMFLLDQQHYQYLPPRAMAEDPFAFNEHD